MSRRPWSRDTGRLLICVASIAAMSVVAAVGGGDSAAAADGYIPLPAPQRLLDTRPGEPTADGEFAGIGVRQAGSTTAVRAAGRVGLGDEPGTIVLNLTVDQPTAPGFITVWPCEADRPTASNLNYVGGQTVAVAAVSRVGGDGDVCFYTPTRTHLIVDVAGSFPAGTFDALNRPERLADSRRGEPTVDGRFRGDGPIVGGRTYRLRVAGRGSVPRAATSAAINVTAVEPVAPGFVTVYPCDAARPTASNVNIEPGLVTPNLVVTRLDPNGDVCLFTLVTSHLVVDVAGTFPSEVFTPLPEPRRILETRVGEPTFDDQFRGGGQQMARSTLQLDVAGRSGIPKGVSAVVLNVTSTGSAAPGFVTAHPQGTKRPGSSNVNVVPGRSVANLVVAAVGPTGDVCLYNSGPTHLVVDVAGWLEGPAPAGGGGSCPTRPAHASASAFREAFVRRPALHRVVGTDRVAVYICDVDGSEQHGVTPAEFAEFARDTTAAYFSRASGGRYAVEYVAAGRFSAGPDGGPSACLDGARRRTTGTFTNALVAGSTSDSGGGFASPGTIFIGFNPPDIGALDATPATSGRGGWIGGSEISTFPDPATIVHEIGHTLHWPHSFIGPSEYDNPVDIMSGGSGPCSGGGYIWPCAPGNTLAFNRFAADWLGSGQVNAHVTGTANYLLDAPLGNGLQLLLAPDPAQPWSALTLETRVAKGLDDFIEREGVAVHVIDQVERTGGLSGLSTGRFTRQARGAADTYDHLVRVGESAVIHGLRVTVLGRVGDAFAVRVAGSYRSPAGSYFTQSVVGGGTTCAVLDIDAAFAAGCLR